MYLILNTLNTLNRREKMTKQLDHKQYSTAFSKWLREQKELDSKAQGIIISDIDYVILNYVTDKFIILEEKARNTKVKFPQSKILERLHKCCKTDDKYCGGYTLTFSGDSPENSEVITISNWDTKIKRQITKEQLTYFLLHFYIPDTFELDFWKNF